MATRLGKAYHLKNGKVEKKPVFHNASQRAKHRKPNRTRVKVARSKRV